MSMKNWGFDVRNMDTNVRPQDDFFHYANGGWMKKNPIPASESRWGTFVKLRFDVDKQLRTIMNELLAQKRVAQGSSEQLIRDFFRSGMDMERRNELDLKPLEAYRDDIAAIQSKKDFERVLADLSRIGVEVPFATGIDQDDKNSEQYVLRIAQDGLGLPDRDYYLKDDKESVRVRTAYVLHVERLYRLMGRSAKVAREQTAAHLSLETALARVSMNKEDRREADKIYHKMTVAQLEKTAPAFDWALFLKRIGAASLKTLIVNQPEFLSAVSKMLEEVPLAAWKDYLEWHLVNDYSGTLSERFIRQAFSFYGTVLTGTKQMRPLWRRVLGAVNGNVGELLGKIYVKKHFPPQAKKKMQQLVADLLEAYEARINALEWMTPKTKKKALAKLNALNPKIGYPDRWKSYAGLVIRPDDYVGNIMRASEQEHKRQMRKLSKPVDRKEWFMYPQTVNAYFSPNMNDIVFPAAILQPPFFHVDGDDAVNYGCIGMTIGHEITHGFDDEGAKFDEKGNLKSWWTPEDKKRFEARAQVLKKQFDQYEVADGVKVNGKLTLGENIADLGGTAIALDAYRLRAAKNAKPDIEGLSPTQRFFLGLAVFECENTRPEFEKMMVLNDPHSPCIFRINGPASNLPEFYEAFNVKKGDKLYRDPTSRAKIW